MFIRSASRLALPRAAGVAAALLLIGGASSLPPALARPQPSITLSSSVQNLKATRAAAAAKLPQVQKQREPRTFAIISQLPLVLQEAYLTTLNDYPKLSPAEQTKFNEIVDSLGFLPKSTTSRAAALLNAQFPAKVSQDKIAKARSNLHETCWLINAAIARAKAQVRH